MRDDTLARPYDEPSWLYSAGGAVQRLLRALAGRRAVLELATLDDHLLADLGLTRADVRCALNRPLPCDPSLHLANAAAGRLVDRPWRPPSGRAE